MVSKRLPKTFKYDRHKFVLKAQQHFQRDGISQKIMNEHDLHFPSNTYTKI